MRILFLTSDLPFQSIRHGGGELNFNTLSHLARSHEVHLLSFIREEEKPFLPEVRKICRSVRVVPALRGWFSRLRRLPRLFLHPYPVVATDSLRMRRELRDLTSLHRFDLIQIDHFHMGQYLADLPPSLPRVLLFEDIPSSILRQGVRISRGYRKWLLYREWNLSRRWEKRYAVAAGGVFVLSLKDKRVVESWDVGARCFVLPALFGERFFEVPAGETESGCVLFVGAMHRPANIDAALLLRNRIMPLVARECPGARLAVVGNNPPSRLRALSGRDFLVTGAVESIEPFLAKAAVFAAPLRVAGGVIVKILQAMAAGKPVVASRCANAGIGAEEEEEILLADRPEDFARRVIELLKDPGRAAALGQAARRFVRERFNPARARQRIDEIYASAARPAEDLGEGGGLARL